jgi:hypothetical protein
VLKLFRCFEKEIQINLVRDPYKARFQTCVMSSLLGVSPPQDQTLSMWVILTRMSYGVCVLGGFNSFNIPLCEKGIVSKMPS